MCLLFYKLNDTLLLHIVNILYVVVEWLCQIWTKFSEAKLRYVCLNGFARLARYPSFWVLWQPNSRCDRESKLSGTCKLRNGKKRKETNRNGKKKKNEKKTRRKVTKRNAKKRNAKKRKQNSEKRNETKEKEKKRKKRKETKRNEKYGSP